MQNPRDRSDVGPRSDVFAQLSDLMRWGAILGGLFAALGFELLSASLGLGILTVVSPGVPITVAAIGIGGAVWGIITFFLATFIGGWVSARSLAVGGVGPALLNATVVWGLVTSVTALVLVIPLAFLTSAEAWAAFVAIALGLGTAMLGAWIGMHPESEYIGR
ncbi:MAG: hypothetical protein ACYC1C_15080 [Chloroflexota bacterium]